MLKKANVTQQNQDFEWNSIKWKEVNNMVNNLRQRLYRATEEGDLKKVRNLQKLILRSHSNKLQAIRKVTLQNSGKNTPGIDGFVAISNKERKLLYNKLSQEKEPQSQVVKRVYISKENGKEHPLGLPTIADRCRQSIVKTALEPYWEVKFEGSSYGFRPSRGTHDAIQKIFCITRSGSNRPWILDADIKGAFD